MSGKARPRLISAGQGMEIKRKIKIMRIIFLPPRWGKLSVPAVPNVPRPDEHKKPSHKYPQRRRKKNKTGAGCGKINRTGAGAADLLPGHVVVPRLKPAAGIRPASRLVASQNLWPRHLLLFIRWLLGILNVRSVPTSVPTSRQPSQTDWRVGVVEWWSDGVVGEGKG